MNRRQPWFSAKCSTMLSYRTIITFQTVRRAGVEPTRPKRQGYSLLSLPMLNRRIYISFSGQRRNRTAPAPTRPFYANRFTVYRRERRPLFSNSFSYLFPRKNPSKSLCFLSSWDFEGFYTLLEVCRSYSKLSPWLLKSSDDKL